MKKMEYNRIIKLKVCVYARYMEVHSNVKISFR